MPVRMRFEIAANFGAIRAQITRVCNVGMFNVYMPHFRLVDFKLLFADVTLETLLALVDYCHMFTKALWHLEILRAVFTSRNKTG